MTEQEPRLVLRYAEEEDASDIASLILLAYQPEMFGGAFGFRRTSLVSLSQVLEDVDSDTVRWLVVEAEGDTGLLAAARMHTQDNGSVLIDIMAVAEELQRKGLGTWLLRRIESMAAEMGVGNVVVEIAQCRDDLVDWLTRRQYKRMGGYVSEDLISGIDDRPVTFLQFQRQVKTAKSESEDESAAETARLALAVVSTAFADVLTSEMEERTAETTQPATAEASNSLLEKDIADLFAALHRTYEGQDTS